MALNMPNKAGVQSIAQPSQSQSVQPVVMAVQPAGTVLLELGLYVRYTRHGRLFTKGNIYRFNAEQAIRLLGEHDRGRPIWRRWRKPEPKIDPLQRKVDGIIDATGESIRAQPEGDPLDGPRDQINIGNEDEILNLLSESNDLGGELNDLEV
jgi:hypothetical protein